MKRLTVCFVAMLLLTAFAAVAVAQTETGQIIGTVTDPTKALVPNAKVTVKSVSTEAVRSTTTSGVGTYTVTNLQPGLYDVTVEAPGFAKTTKRVQVTVGGRVAEDFGLEVGAEKTVVEVTAEAGVLINTETQTISKVIDSKMVMELPTLTRNPYALVGTTSNVSGADPSGRGAGYAINGLRSAGTNILLDGAANNDEFVASVGQGVPLDSVQEFSVLTNNFTAEFGRAAAGVVNLATKGGTNAFHGTGYEFNRVSSLASNSFDNNANALPKPIFVRNQFGYSIGGPVKKNKLFFFNSTEWIRVRSAATQISLVPTTDLLAASNANTKGFFSSLGKVRSGVVNLGTLTKASIGAGTLCNTTGPCASLAANTPVFTRVAFNVPQDSGGGDPQNTTQTVGRVDYNMSDKTQIYARYAMEKGQLLPGTVSYSAYDGYDTGQTTFNNNYLVSLTHTLSPRLVTQSKLVYNRLNTQQPLGRQAITPTLYMRTSTTRVGADRINMPGYLPFSPGSGIPFGGPQNFLQGFQDVSFTKGSHQTRFGGNYTYIQDNRTFGAYETPSATLGSNLKNAMDNFLNGQLLSFQSAINPQGKFPCGAVVNDACTVKLPVGQPNFSRSNRYHEFGIYFQDSWRATRRLTFNLGVRWEYFGVQHNRDARLDSNYYDGSGGSIYERIRNGSVAIVPDSPIKGLWGKDLNNFAPRLGFAWDMFGDAKTSLRGGYGLAYERNFGNVTFNVIQNPPNYAVIAVTAGVDLPNIPITTAVAGPLAGTTGTKALPKVSLRNVISDIRTAYAHLYSMSLERQVTKGLIMALDYSGSKGSKLYSLENPSRTGAGNVYMGDPCTAGDPNSCVSRLRTTQYTGINRRGQSAYSHHNALTVRSTIQNLANSGVNVSMNYTWAHTIDNLSSTFSESANNFNLGLLDPFKPDLDRGNADFDIRHRFVLAGTWEVPFARNLSNKVAKHILHGWEFAPILTLNTGAPFTIFDCTNAFYEVCPRLMLTATGNVSRSGVSNPPQAKGEAPNTLRFLEMPAASVNSNYVNAISGTSEFGPYPRMTARNFYRGPGNWNLNLGIYKNFQLTERFKLQLRGETYNTFNHANLSVLGSAADVSSYDYIQARRDGRRDVQFALKLIF